ncbi:MAG TPA: MFS transporter [Kofleriaceae bacterium]|nr:MFS transporter [Kofleriaceae bacterium]
MIRDRRAILALLTALNFLNYIDRAVIAAVLKPMRGELALSNFEAGLLNTAFLIGYFVTSPWFGARADKSARMGLIALGVVIWSIATVASGLATGFWSLLAARIVVGVGEASFTVLAPTVIDDIMPSGNKGKALAVFFLAIPLGYAMGYILGGSIAHHWATQLNPVVIYDHHVSFAWDRLEHHLDPVVLRQHVIVYAPDSLAAWRTAFLITGGPGVALALTCLLIAEPARKLLDTRARLIDGLREMIAIPLFRRAVLGYCAYVAAVAGFSYWAPNFLLERFPGRLNDETANFWFGIVLIAAGAIGTFAGGQWTDRGQRALPAAAPDAPYDAAEHKACVNVALRVCAVGMAVAAPLAAVCFLLPSPTLFFVVAFVVEIGVFLSTSPINIAIMRAVPVELRASAVAASVFAIHLFGDLWSSAALGLLQDVLPIILAMMAIPLTFAGSAYIWWPRRREAAAGG